MGTTSSTDTGRSCPYCRFPLKDGQDTETCSACGAVHHGDCWLEGGGCAVVGCSNGPSPERQATKVMPTAGPVFPPQQVYSTEAEPQSREGRSVMIGLMAGLLVVAVGGGGYALASGQNSAPVTVSTPTEAVTTAPTTEPTVAPVDDQRQVATQIADVLSYSQQGRSAVTSGNFSAAISNREEVIRQLDAINGAQGQLASAQQTFRSAMEASLTSDRHYAAGESASASDAEATRLKREFLSYWNPIASQYGLSTYSESTI